MQYVHRLNDPRGVLNRHFRPRYDNKEPSPDNYMLRLQIGQMVVCRDLDRRKKITTFQAPNKMKFGGCVMLYAFMKEVFAAILSLTVL